RRSLLRGRSCRQAWSRRSGYRRVSTRRLRLRRQWCRRVLSARRVPGRRRLSRGLRLVLRRRRPVVPAAPGRLAYLVRTGLLRLASRLGIAWPGLSALAGAAVAERG